MAETYPDMLLVCMLEPVEPGEEFLKVPPHVTVQSWFSVPAKYEGAFLNGLINRVHELAPITITGGEKALFGYQGRVPVRKLARGIGQLASLHEITGELITRYGDQCNEADTYEPHVSDVDGKSFAADETAVLKGLQMLRRSPGEPTRRVEHALYFGKEKS
jgi:hypothetical protein